MGSRYLTDLAKWCRDAGFVVHEMHDWQTNARGSGGYDSGRPWCIMWHHTASSADPEDDAAYIAYGHEDSPISNLLLDREGEVWICAAGATNTNGKGRSMTFSKGTVPADSMNTYAVGIEAANNGIGEPWPQVQIDAYFKLNNLLAAKLGFLPSDLSSHHLYAPDRKIDPATAGAVLGNWRPSSVNSSGSWDTADMQREATARSNPAPPPEDDDVAEIVEIRVEEADAAFLGVVAKCGDVTGVLWCEWVNGKDAAQLDRLRAYQGLGARVMTMKLKNFEGIGLLGPIPTGDGRHTWSRSDFGSVIT